MVYGDLFACRREAEITDLYLIQSQLFILTRENLHNKHVIMINGDLPGLQCCSLQILTKQWLCFKRDEKESAKPPETLCSTLCPLRKASIASGLQTNKHVSSLLKLSFTVDAGPVTIRNIDKSNAIPSNARWEKTVRRMAWLNDLHRLRFFTNN